MRKTLEGLTAATAESPEVLVEEAALGFDNSRGSRSDLACHLWNPAG